MPIDSLTSCLPHFLAVLFCNWWSLVSQDLSFLEDINILLNSGDIPNLFDTDERLEIVEKMQHLAQSDSAITELSPLVMYQKFVERVRCHLHIAITFSPIGEAFRARLRMFPALISCCTIDWFKVGHR